MLYVEGLFIQYDWEQVKRTLRVLLMPDKAMGVSSDNY